MGERWVSRRTHAVDFVGPFVPYPGALGRVETISDARRSANHFLAGAKSSSRRSPAPASPPLSRPVRTARPRVRRASRHGPRTGPPRDVDEDPEGGELEAAVAVRAGRAAAADCEAREGGMSIHPRCYLSFHAA